MFVIHRKKSVLLGVLVLLISVFAFVFGVNKVANTDETQAAASGLPDKGNVVEVRFLRVVGETSILKTYDNKYILMDTGKGGEGSTSDKELIYGALKDAQGKEKVTIDYMIISHLDGDHYENASWIFANNNITVNNLVVKYEKEYKPKVYRNIVANGISGNPNIQIYTSSNVKTDINNGTMKTLFNHDSVYNKFVNQYHVLNSDEAVAVGDYLNLYFYNVNDIFTGKTCEEGRIFTYTGNAEDTNLARFDANGKLNMKSGKYYLYFDGGNYPNSTYKLTTKPNPAQKNTKEGDWFLNRYWYAKIPNIEDLDNSSNYRSSCKSNPNAYGVLIEVKNGGANNKYIYYSNDLENIGYGVIPTDGIYGNYAGIMMSTYDVNVGSNGKVTFNVISNQNTHASETKAARAVYNRLTNNGANLNNLNNIVVYQQSHHGKNDAPDAINRLGINNNDNVFIIAAVRSDPRGNPPTSLSWSFMTRRSYYYALKGVPEDHKLYTFGGTAEVGIPCAIGVSGTTLCYYPNSIIYKKKTLTYNLNGGDSGAPAKEVCTVSNIDSGASTIEGEIPCRVSISSSKPAKKGNKFLGWADSASATSASYIAGRNLNISSNQTVYAVWQQNPTYTLTYNLNGGTGSINQGSCTPDGDATSCKVTAASSKPTRDNYVFLGWADSASATSASVNPGSNVTLSANRTIYAVWKEKTDSEYNLLYDLNGGEGAIDSISCTVENGECIVSVSSEIPAREGYNFLGWADSASATSASIDPGSELTLTEDKTIYAVWTLKTVSTYILTYDLNEGAGEINNEHCETTEASCQVKITTEKPTKEGYNFLGWADNVAGSAEYHAGDMMNLIGNKTIYAVWGMDDGSGGSDGKDPEEGDETDGSDGSSDSEGSKDSDGSNNGAGLPDTGGNYNSSNDNNTDSMTVMPIVFGIMVGAVVYIVKKMNKRVKFD